MLPPPSDRFASDAASETGRHRRPETLADSRNPAGSARWSPSPLSPWPSPSPSNRSAGTEFHHADDLIRQARRAAGRAEFAARASEASRASETTRTPETTRAPEATRAPETTRAARRDRAASRPHSRRAAGPRGRHAAPADHDSLSIRDSLDITVRPLSAVRDWAMDTGGKPSAVGTHRVPGTLPIESWLLIGRGRQQALLAGLVAVGLALVMIPTAAQRTADPIAASGTSSVATTAPAAQPERERETTGDRGGGGAPASTRPEPPATPEPPAATTAPAPSATPADEPPLIDVPPGDGPHRSLRTTGSQVVALTFDDGPDPVQTPRILALLAQHDVKATFCLVGAQAARHPDIVRQIAAAGHTLCNHTWDHSLTIGKARPDAIAADLARTDAAIRAAVPDAPIPFFRAPGGNFTDRLVEVAYQRGQTSLYWEVDPRDWEHREPGDDATHPDRTHTDRIVAEVRAAVKPGAIVLSHDFNQPDTVAAYETLLPYLSENFELGVPTAHPVSPNVAPADT